jgi:hypothetical protein
VAVCVFITAFCRSRHRRARSAEARYIFLAFFVNVIFRGSSSKTEVFRMSFNGVFQPVFARIAQSVPVLRARIDRLPGFAVSWACGGTKKQRSQDR